MLAYHLLNEGIYSGKSFLDLFAILWFIIGNYFLFTSETCPRDAPMLFYTTLVWTSMSYLLIFIPLLLCAAVIFCLPCVLVAMRAMHIDVATGMVGATKDEIDKVPVYRYKSAASSDTPPDPAVAETMTKKKTGLMHRFLQRHQFKNDQESQRQQSFEELTGIPADDAVCSICLSEYENGHLVCKLW
ncbi:uncharacterized protein BYT42DRAFT_501308 [Radiomyces spectabilis]|uniref:uncharacterized protein n=1 Tax=Radiomyces spectabilis TaxID=64574 RepID=UPI00221EEF1F|nr:uncharacterized protein BYT42DRAFT_501308 [Radiomyces spectabilis]KAI8371686.1 hypothetical protein BYT42DRAFT_501308 [Radiomyces spectabilis]